MARTPLLTRFQGLYRDFAESEHSGRTVQEVQAERRQRGPNRRDFMKMTGATVGAAALSGPIAAFAGSTGTPGRIAIIGGGIAGLNAALTLHDAGIASTVYEASNRIGGRMHSDTTSWLNEQVSEHCGELIDTKHKTILGLAQRFGIEINDLLAAQPAQSTDTYWFFSRYYTDDQANSDFQAVYSAVKKDLNAAGFPTLYHRYNQAGWNLDHMSLYDWIESRVPGGHNSPMGRLLDIAYNTEYGGETSVQSALNIIYLLAYQPQTGDFRIFGASDERYHMHGGNERLPRAIAAVLPAGSIKLNTSLTSISRNSDGTYALTFSTGEAPLKVTADRVIMAIPFSILRNLTYKNAGFNQVKTTAIQQLGYGTNSKLHLQFDSRLWNTAGPWGISTGYTFTDDGYQNTWDVTRAQDGITGILVNYSGGNYGASLSNPSAATSYAQAFLTRLEPVFPGITALWNGRATIDYPAGNPYLLGSYSFWKVGQYTLFSGAERERSNKCHFAGEHCSINFQGYMEGGASEGARAANEILSDYKAGIFP
ncbi:MAG: hypothetical protein PVSMB9_04080 [Candidatus Dormibacteria bacterium]